MHFIKILVFVLVLAIPSFSEDFSVEDSRIELTKELAFRDSLMNVRDSSFLIEKDSLRKQIEIEQAKSANWEQSYNTVKKNNEMCAQALRVSIGVNEKKKEQVEKEKNQAAMMTTTSFLGGLGIGLLIMWLIMD